MPNIRIGPLYRWEQLSKLNPYLLGEIICDNFLDCLWKVKRMLFIVNCLFSLLLHLLYLCIIVEDLF